MWIGDEVPLELQRNASLVFSGSIWDEVSNTYVDITGEDISCAVAKVAGGEIVALPMAIIDAPTEGGFTITFVGSAFDDVDGQMEPVILAYDVRIGTSVVMRGPLTLLPGVGN